MKSELVEINKSVLGRALVGGVLLGGIGALVGAVSGTGKKMKSDPKLYFIIGYTNSNGTEKFLQFEDTRRYKGKQLAEKLRLLSGLHSTDNDAVVDL